MKKNSKKVIKAVERIGRYCDEREGEGKPKWIDILDATKRPKANEQVLITTKIGKVTIACFDEDGKVHTQIGNKVVQALAWMPMPKAYDTERA